MMWLGLAAILVGVMSFAIDWSWQVQLVAFAIFTALSVPLWRRFARKVDPQLKSPYLNRRTEALVGRVFTLENPILDGVGRVRIDDTVWRVSGPDAAAGSRVKVIARADRAEVTRSSPLSSDRGPHVMRSGRHRNGSNECFNRDWKRLRYCNMRCWPMFASGQKRTSGLNASCLLCPTKAEIRWPREHVR